MQGSMMPAPYGIPQSMQYHPQPMQYSVGQPMIQPMVQPMVQVPMGYPGYPHFSFMNRVRGFFGLPPKIFRYKSDRGTWGFMGYSRRQRYIDPRTGGEVDRHGRPVVRVN